MGHRILLFLGLIAFLVGCTTSRIESENGLFSFVGEKINLEDFIPLRCKLPLSVCLDSAFIAKYKILEKVYGDHSGTEIKFIVFDHYGVPRFSEYDQVLLFVSTYKGKNYHEKYQFYPVHKTTDGDWAYCGDPYGENYPHPKPVIPQKLEFTHPIKYPISDEADIALLNEKIPTQYFFIEDRNIVCTGYGIKVADLFEIKKQGVLKARGIFD